MDVHCKKDFGSELAAHIPYAYYLHTQNKLKSTTSSLLSKEFYYFSDDHKHTPPNKPNKVETNVLDTTLNVTDLNREQYIPPPYKDIPVYTIRVNPDGYDRYDVKIVTQKTRASMVAKKIKELLEHDSHERQGYAKMFFCYYHSKANHMIEAHSEHWDVEII